MRDAVELVRIGAGGEARIVGAGRDAGERVAGGAEAGVRDRIHGHVGR